MPAMKTTLDHLPDLMNEYEIWQTAEDRIQRRISAPLGLIIHILIPVFVGPTYVFDRAYNNADFLFRVIGAGRPESPDFET